MKKYLKSYLYLLSIIIILTIMLSVINYFLPLPAKTIKTIIPIIAVLFSSIILGKNTKEKAYLEGIKFITPYLIIIILINIILKYSFTIKQIIFYLILLVTSIISSMIGINIKKK